MWNLLLSSSLFRMLSNVKNKTLLYFYRIAQKKHIQVIWSRGKVNVVFFAFNLSMWRYQGLYDIMKDDPRFCIYIIVYPVPSFSKEENEKNYQDLKQYFTGKNMSYIRMEDLPKKIGLKSLNPDLLFYAQQYDSLLPKNIDASYFYDKLVCYIPYGLNTLNHNWNYNTRFQNFGWHMYYANNLLREDAINMTYCKGDNVIVVGDPHGDEFVTKSEIDPWINADGKKRIIWAPHFRIISNDTFNRPSFLWTYNVMLDLAEKYKDYIHIAFKPHPRLFYELCNCPDWGESKAKKYYQKWQEMPNTQFENGEYIELFKTSDALIHGCGSFTAEYQYTKKPCMYLTREEEAIKDELCPFGLKCFNNHYIGTCKDDIEAFIKNVVIDGFDLKIKDRETFYHDYLQPINGKTSSENIYNNIVNELFPNS